MLPHAMGYRLKSLNRTFLYKLLNAALRRDMDQTKSTAYLTRSPHYSYLYYGRLYNGRPLIRWCRVLSPSGQPYPRHLLKSVENVICLLALLFVLLSPFVHFLYLVDVSSCFSDEMGMRERLL